MPDNSKILPEIDEKKILSELEECMSFDTESAHYTGDEILCKLLQDLGYSEIVEAWENLPKWYS